MTRRSQKKVFLAITLPTEWISVLGSYQHRLQILFPDIRLTPERNFHLTLAYYGLITSDRISLISSTLDTYLQNIPAFMVYPGEPGNFDHRKRKIFWFGVTSTCLQEPALFARELGTEPHTEAFKPHITLGRLNNYQKPVNLPPIHANLRPFSATELILYESINDHFGPKYLPIKSWSLI